METIHRVAFDEGVEAPVLARQFSDVAFPETDRDSARKAARRDRAGRAPAVGADRRGRLAGAQEARDPASRRPSASCSKRSKTKRKKTRNFWRARADTAGMSRPLAIAVLVLVPHLALARPKAKTKLGGEMADFAAAVERVAGGAEPSTTYTPDACAKAAAKDGSPEAHAVCVELAQWIPLATVRKQLHEYQHSLDVQGMYAASDKNVAAMAAEGRKCTADVERAIADGAPADREITVSSELKLTLADAKTRVCGAFGGASDTMATRGKEEKAAEAARRKEAAATYKAGGSDGERLKLLVDEDGAQWYGAGKAMLSSPKQLARATVLFEILTDSTRGVWTVTRFQFSGNKRVKTTSTEYDHDPAEEAFK